MSFQRVHRTSTESFEFATTPAATEPAAFTRCLVEPDSATAAGIRHRRQRALGISAFLEVSIVAAILIWPLFATGTKLVRRVFIPIPPYGVHHSQAHHETSQHTPISRDGFRYTGTHSFPGPHAPANPPQSNPSNTSVVDIPGTDIGIGATNANPGALIEIDSNESAPSPPRPEALAPRTPSAPVRRSEGVQAALLIHRVEPRYPALARQSRREGTVQLHAVIARDGSIESLEVLSGDPLFIRDALEAVRQWRYRPTMLGCEPVEVETFITLNFRLSH